MNTGLNISLGLLVWGSLLTSGCANAETNQSATAAAAIQVIQQAPDPSAVIAAYGSGLAIAPNDPMLHEAYVVRMVDMGLPEMAFHQAQTLATLEPNNGLAWGVVAYVDARRGQMPEAISAVNLAGQFAPSNRFVAHTAGEILAWYDLKADKARLPDNAKDGLVRIRGLLDKQAGFTEAYDTARKAYQTQTNAAQPTAQAAPAQTASTGPTPATPGTSSTSQGPYAPQAVTAPQTVSPTDQGGAVTYVPSSPVPVYTPAYYPVYYDWAPNYCYDWGLGWVAPTPWCWWQPCGLWGGCSFFPFGLTFAFGDFDDFDHSHHGHGFDHDGDFGHHGGFVHGQDPALWHGDAHGSSRFFGTPARANSSLTQWNRQGIEGRSSTFAASTGTHWWGGAGQPGTTSSFSALGRPSSSTAQWNRQGLASRLSTVAASTSTRSWSGAGQPGAIGSRAPVSPGGATFAQNGARAPQGIRGAAPLTAGRSGALSRSPVLAAPATHDWSSTLRSYQAAPVPRATSSAPTFRAPVYSAPRYAAPTTRSFGIYHAAPSFGGGWARSTPSYSAPAVHSFSGGFSSGGFHGGSSFHSSGGSISSGHSFSGGSHGGGFGGGFRGGGRR